MTLNGMKRSVAVVWFAVTAYATEVTDPQSHVINRRYEAGDVIKLMTFDINGDGVLDLFFTTIEGHPDPTTVTSNEQIGGSLSWDAYVSKAGRTNFIVNDGLEIDAEVTQGTGINVDPDDIRPG